MNIAILGTENSHAYAFSKLIATDPRFADMRVAGIYGYDDAANRKIVDEGFASFVADDPSEFLGKVDGVMVTARHGSHHYEYGMPYIKAGMPVFIDKPFAFTSSQALSMIREAQKSGSPLCGGSSLRLLDELTPLKEKAAAALAEGTLMGGHIAAPINMVNEYGGFFFYAEHLLDITTTVFGCGIRRVFASCPDTRKNSLDVIFFYDGFSVSGKYYDGYYYTGQVYAKDAMQSFSVDSVHYCYGKELEEFRAMAGTGKMPVSYEELAFPVKVMEAMKLSYETGKPVEI